METHFVFPFLQKPAIDYLFFFFDAFFFFTVFLFLAFAIGAWGKSKVISIC